MKNTNDEVKFISQSAGQALPLLLAFITLIVVTFFAVARSLQAKRQEVFEAEKSLHKALFLQTENALQLNVFVNSNLRLKRHLFSWLRVAEMGASSALDLAASPPLWETQLPIPTPFQVFRNMTIAQAQVSQIASENAIRNLNAINSLDRELQSQVHTLSISQSLCLLACLPEAASLIDISTTDCRNLETISESCTLHLRTAQLGAPFLSHIKINDLLQESFTPRVGFVLLKPQRRSSVKVDEGLNSKKITTHTFEPMLVHLVHPRLKSTSLNGKSNAKTEPKTSERTRQSEWLLQMSFEPQWSVEVRDAQ